MKCSTEFIFFPGKAGYKRFSDEMKRPYFNETFQLQGFMHAAAAIIVCVNKICYFNSPSSRPRQRESKAGVLIDRHTNANDTESLWRYHLTPHHRDSTAKTNTINFEAISSQQRNIVYREKFYVSISISSE